MNYLKSISSIIKFSFSGVEIPAVIAGELKDAPRVIYPVLKRGWIRITMIYLVALLLAGTLASSKTLEDQMTNPPNDAPWSSSPFITALMLAGERFSWISHVVVVCFILSAASAGSAGVFISARYLYYLAKAGHAPQIFGKVWPRASNRVSSTGIETSNSVVPWAGVIATAGFAGISWLCVRPTTNTISDREKGFLQLSRMASAGNLQAWIGLLFTYLRFWRGTNHPSNQRKYKNEIARIKQNRAWGQPFWAMWSFTVCILIFLFNGWSLFNHKNATWVIFWENDPVDFNRYNVAQFITTTVPIPLLLLVVFGYKLICQTSLIRADEMNFSGVAGMDLEDKDPVEKPPRYFWSRIWWILVK